MDAKRTAPPQADKRLLVLFAIGLALAFGILIVGGGWVAWRVVQRNRSEAVNLEAEREADRIDVAEAFASEKPVSASDRAEFSRIFERMQKVMNDGLEFDELFDVDRMNFELSRVSGQRSAELHAVESQEVWDRVGWAVIANELVRFQTHEIRHVRWSDDRREAAVIVVLSGAEGKGVKRRFWLRNEKRIAWKLFDVENLDHGFRALHVSAEFRGPDFGDDSSRVQRALEGIRNAADSIGTKNWNLDYVEGQLLPSRSVRLPNALAAQRELVEGMLKSVRGDGVGSLKHFEVAATLFPSMPLLKLWHGHALMNLKRYDEALEPIRGYLRDLGPDSAAYCFEGEVLEGLKRKSEASKAYRSAFEEDRDSVVALQGLRRTLEDKTELGERLFQSPKATESFNYLVSSARADGDRESVKVLLAAMKRNRPDDPRIAVEEIREFISTKKYGEAATRLNEGVKAADAAERTQILNAYLFAMLDENKIAEAYEGVPPNFRVTAFRSLADSLEEILSDREDFDKSNTPELLTIQMRQLLALHWMYEPHDLWLNVYEGSLHQSNRAYDKADAQYADGMKKLGPMAQDQDADRNLRNAFRWRRVNCLYKLKQGLKAYASVGPDEKTFQQLANFYDSDKDAAGLSALIALHENQSTDSTSLKFWRAEAQFLKGQYAAAAGGFREYREVAGDKDPESYRSTDRLLRSLVRANDLPAARRLVDEIGIDKAPQGLRGAIEAAAGDVAALEVLLTEQQKRPGGLWSYFYDEDFVRLFEAAPFASLRVKFPDPRAKKDN